jgi:serine/threonine protein kinase/tetratricopeptide (TPR) repeat protein
MASAPIFLGPFRLLQPIARGGMAEVWQAEHVDGAQVAVKVLSPHVDGDPELLRTLRNETEAVAALDHPAIAMVLDYGVVTAAAAAASGARLVVDSPWLAMELASGGALAGARGRLDWVQVRHVLAVVLDALAHAHARGVVHRDLKPANILLCTGGDARPGIKLTDFGMAGRLDDDVADRLGFSGGTPKYMAPEQFRGEHHLVGPWTDLYAVGCLTYTLATRKPPFLEKGWRELAHAHAVSEPRELRPDFPAPDGLGAWVARLLDKRPQARFATAADAAWALRQLDGAPVPDPRVLPAGLRPAGLRPLETSGTRAAPPVKAQETSDKVSSAPTRRRHSEAPKSEEGAATTLEPSLPTVSLVAADLPRPLGAPSLQGPAPPLADDWRRPFDGPGGAATAQLFGAGLSLFGVRRAPLVGREAERDALWDELKAVADEGRARAVVLRGGAGAGKSRLAMWLTERAHEVGGATSLRAQHALVNGPADGLAPMVARHLRVTRLDADAARRRTWAWHNDRGLSAASDPDVVAALADRGRPSEGAVTLRGADERHDALLAFLRLLARVRPLVVWLDDVQWGADALALASRALERRDEEPAPVLFVLTARAEAAFAAPTTDERLAAIAAHDHGSLHEVAPLPATDQVALVRALLPFDRAVAEAIAIRTEGNPLFAVQLVADQVQRRAFVLGPGGFDLAEGEAESIPDDLHALWMQHASRVVGEEVAAQTALQRAATLGEHVLLEEWRAVCGADEAELGALLDRLVRGGLIVRTDEGFSFSHGMLRESLEREARDNGSWREHNAAVAHALAALWGKEVVGVSARLGRHLVEAGEYEAALPELLAGATELARRNELREAHRVLDAWDDAASALGIDDEDVRHADAELLRIQLLTALSGSTFDADARARQALDRARRPTWASILPDALRLRAVVAYRQGRLDAARELYGEAMRVAEARHDEVCLLSALMGTADVDYYQARRDAAAKTYRRALRIADGRGDVPKAATCLWSLGCIEEWRGELDRAEQLFLRQTDLMEAEGDRLGTARGYNSLGECRRLQGRFDEAEADLRRAVTLLRAIGARSTAIVEMNLALVTLDRGDVATARAELTRLVDDLERALESIPAWIGALLLARCAAEEGDWGEVDARLSAVLASMDEAGVIEGDLGEQLHIIGRLALEAGETTRARRALQQARRQWQGAGWTEKLDEVDAMLASL